MSAFIEAIERELAGLESPAVGPAPRTCAACKGRHEDDDEGSFSWSRCDSCGSTFGGDRYVAHALRKGRSPRRRANWIHLSICSDCLFFHANGDEPEDWSQHP